MNIRSERSRRRNRPPRLRGLSLNRLLPNMLTMLALCAGVTAMRFAIQGRFEAAVVSVPDSLLRVSVSLMKDSSLRAAASLSWIILSNSAKSSRE